MIFQSTIILGSWNRDAHFPQAENPQWKTTTTGRRRKRRNPTTFQNHRCNLHQIDGISTPFFPSPTLSLNTFKSPAKGQKNKNEAHLIHAQNRFKMHSSENYLFYRNMNISKTYSTWKKTTRTTRTTATKKLLLVYDIELLNPHTKETNRKSIQNWKETKMIEGRDWKGLRKDLMDRTVVTDWNCEDRKKASCRTETPSKYTITISCCSRIEREKEIFG